MLFLIFIDKIRFLCYNPIRTFIIYKKREGVIKVLFILPDDFYILKWFYYSILKEKGEQEAKEFLETLLKENRVGGDLNFIKFLF